MIYIKWYITPTYDIYQMESLMMIKWVELVIWNSYLQLGLFLKHCYDVSDLEL